jgi:hypothetical protein
MSNEAYKSVLLIVNDSIMPFLQSPLLLSDFLGMCVCVCVCVCVCLSVWFVFTMPSLYHTTHIHIHTVDSYAVGGVVSVLALSGLFTLIHKHNFTYPSFYPQLYRLLQPALFLTKHRSKFYRLLALFLSRCVCVCL